MDIKPLIQALRKSGQSTVPVCATRWQHNELAVPDAGDTLGNNCDGVSTTIQFGHHVTQPTNALLSAHNGSSQLTEEFVPTEEKVALGQALLCHEYSIKCSVFKFDSYIIDAISFYRFIASLKHFSLSLSLSLSLRKLK